jgi:hypothetical protein
MAKGMQRAGGLSKKNALPSKAAKKNVDPGAKT